MYLFIAKKNYWIAMIPATFMTMATTTYILNAAIGFGLPMNVSYIGATIITVVIIALFYNAAIKSRTNNLQLDDDMNIAA